MHMKTTTLFPVLLKKIGWILFVPFFALCLYCLFGNGTEIFPVKVFSIISEFPFQDENYKFGVIIENCILDEISIVGLTISLLFLTFSKEKDEDECIAAIRMHSIFWSIIVNYILLILVTIFVYGLSYMIFSYFSLLSLLFIFMIKYNIELYKFRRSNNE